MAQHNALDVDEQYRAEMQAVFARSVMETLGANNFWTERVLKMVSSVMEKLESMTQEGLPVLLVVERLEAASLLVFDLTARCRAGLSRV